MSAAYLREHENGCTLAVRVQPGAKKTAIMGLYGEGEAIKIAVQAPPLEGKANEALIAYLSKLLGLTRSSITIAHGESGRTKLLLLRGLNAAHARATLESILAAG